VEQSITLLAITDDQRIKLIVPLLRWYRIEFITSTARSVQQLYVYINPLRPSGKYMYHLPWQSVMLHFVFISFSWFSLYTVFIYLNSVNQLIFVMVKCGVLFEVRTELLNVI
jgi:hypothetical protein